MKAKFQVMIGQKVKLNYKLRLISSKISKFIKLYSINFGVI